MKAKYWFVPLSLAAIVVAAGISTFVRADTSDAMPEMQLPPGWTAEDMQAYVDAGTPGKMHAQLAQDVGSWDGKTILWMAPGAEPTTGECSMKVSPMMDGRYVKLEMAGEIPGMGSFSGFGISGFDNVSQQFVSTWVDNQGTGILYGTGELSNDGKVMTWNFVYNCPLTKKPTPLREVDTVTGPNGRTFEMYGLDPKSGQEYKMMRIEYTRE